MEEALSAAREGTRPFMSDCFLSAAEGSADLLQEPKLPKRHYGLPTPDSVGP